MQHKTNRVWGRATHPPAVAYLDGESGCVDELGHVAEDTLVPVLKEGGVIRRHRVHGQIFSRSSPRSAYDIGLVEHVLVPTI